MFRKILDYLCSVYEDIDWRVDDEEDVADWDEEVHPAGPVRPSFLFAALAQYIWLHESNLADVVKPLVDIYDILWGVADKEQPDDEEDKNIDLQISRLSLHFP